MDCGQCHGHGMWFVAFGVACGVWHLAWHVVCHVLFGVQVAFHIFSYQ